MPLSGEFLLSALASTLVTTLVAPLPQPPPAHLELQVAIVHQDRVTLGLQ
jgi:hypothetical protein